jgi:hypothetical protein
LTVSLRKKLDKLERMKISHSKYQYTFSTLLDKATKLQSRMRKRDGQSEYKDVVTS